LLAGATVSTVLACRLGGDVRRTDRSDRVHDALLMGGALALAAAAAQSIQIAFGDFMFGEQTFYGLVPIIGLAGFACGAVIGFMVPQACRANIVTPTNRNEAAALRDLLSRAKAVLASTAAAENWVFRPRDDLGGITPAEAVQYQGLATGVRRQIDEERSPGGGAAWSGLGDRSTPAAIERRGDDTPYATLVPDSDAGGDAKEEAVPTSTAGRVRAGMLPEPLRDRHADTRSS
jgi:hypothetical protein